jgi:hypothetical protein
MVDCILRARVETVTGLKTQQDDELHRAQKALEPTKAKVATAHDLVKEELAKAGS